MELLHWLDKPSKKKRSVYRKNLTTATLEGIPAIVTISLLGAPFLTGYLLLLGASSFQIGIVLAVPALFNLVQIPAAYMMQRFTNRRLGLILFAGTHRIIWTLTGAVPLLVSEHFYFELYFIFYSTAFLFNAVGGVVWTSLISDMVPSRVLGRYFGMRNMLLWGTASISLFLGGYILDQVPGMEGYRIIFLICAVGSIMNIIGFCFYPNLPFEKSTAPSLKLMVRKPFENTVFFRSMIFIAVFLFLQNIVVPLFSLIMFSIMDLSYLTVSILSIVQTVSMMISYYFWGNLNARIPTRQLLLWTFPIIAASCLLWGATIIVPAILVLGLIHLLLGVGLGGLNLLLFNFIIGDTPKAERPMYIAVFGAVTGIAAFLGPALGGYIFDRIVHLPQWFQITGLTTGVGMLLMVLIVWFGPAVFGDRVRKQPIF
jgi:MFS family permease